MVEDRFYTSASRITILGRRSRVRVGESSNRDHDFVPVKGLFRRGENSCHDNIVSILLKDFYEWLNHFELN
jgi:hypothetical protein